MEQKRSNTLAFALLFIAGASLLIILGFITAVLLDVNQTLGIESPFATNVQENIQAPSDVLQKKDVEIYPDRVVIHASGVSLGIYAPTGSMKPLLDENANGLRIQPRSADEINVGDIITFTRGEDLIVHRVVEKGTDATGIYFIAKGDSNDLSDGKIRFEDIKYKTIAILY